jgi:flagellar export protein FliJ
MTELQELLAGGEVDVDACAARRYHAGQVVARIRGVEEELRLQGQRVAAARQELVKADQQVKVLEKLEEQQRDEHRVAEERRTARNLEETWQAGRAVQRRTS